MDQYSTMPYQIYAQDSEINSRPNSNHIIKDSRHLKSEQIKPNDIKQKIQERIEIVKKEREADKEQ